MSSLTSDLKITDWDEPSWTVIHCFSLPVCAGFYLKSEMNWRGEGWRVVTTVSQLHQTKYLFDPPCQFSLSTGHGLTGTKFLKIELLLRLWWEIVKSLNRKIVIILLIIDSWASFTAYSLKWAHQDKQLILSSLEVNEAAEEGWGGIVLPNRNSHHWSEDMAAWQGAGHVCKLYNHDPLPPWSG